jgi:hypothetical protein
MTANAPDFKNLTVNTPADVPAATRAGRLK